MSKKIIGIKQADGSFFPILKDGEPANKTLEVTTVRDGQTAVKINLYKQYEDTSDLEYVDTLLIENLVPHLKEEPSFSLSINLDDENVLTAEVLDPETGAKSDTTVSLVTLSEAQLGETSDFSLADDTDIFDDIGSSSLNISDDFSSLADFDDDDIEKNVIDDEGDFFKEDSFDMDADDFNFASPTELEDTTENDSFSMDEKDASITEPSDESFESSSLDDFSFDDSFDNPESSSFSDDFSFDSVSDDLQIDSDTTSDFDIEKVSSNDEEFEFPENIKLQDDLSPRDDDFDSVLGGIGSDISADALSLDDNVSMDSDTENADNEVAEEMSSDSLELGDDDFNMDSLDLGNDDFGSDSLSLDDDAFSSDSLDLGTDDSFSADSLDLESSDSFSADSLSLDDDTFSSDSLDLGSDDSFNADSLSLDDDAFSSDSLDLGSDDDFGKGSLDLGDDTFSSDSLDLSDDGFGNESLSLDDSFAAEDDFSFSPEAEESEVQYADHGSQDITEESSTSFIPPLYDKQFKEDIEKRRTRKKYSLPMIICVTCAIICILAVIFAFSFGTWPGDNPNVVNNVVAVDPPQVFEQERQKEIEEGREAIPPSPEENTIEIVIEKEVIPVKPEPAPEARSENIEYLLRWGDTLWDLSDTYYRNPWLYGTIAEENNIKDPDYIIAGTYIDIPPR